jgi:hypothetical protein
MFDFIVNRKNGAARTGLYCVWIRAREVEGAPLIQVWIDPSMSTFESQANALEPNLAADRAGVQVAGSDEDIS